MGHHPTRGEGDLPWAAYLSEEYDFTDFPAGSLVVDVGFGAGAQLCQLAGRGLRVLGVEVDDELVARQRARGLDVVRASVEALPFNDGYADGLVLKVVLCCTDERRAMRELARVLRPGGTLRAAYNCSGYYLRYLALGPTWRRRVFGLRALLNGWLYSLTGRRLPGWTGDTLYQSERRLGRYYRENGLRLVHREVPKRFLGFPVFAYHTVTAG